MKSSPSTRSPRLLVGLGLVLVGLLAGILGMLFFAPQVGEAPARRVVERVELGGRALSQPATASDSSRPAAPARSALLNNTFRDVAGQVTPAVVYVQVRMKAEGAGAARGPADDDPHQRFFRGPGPRRSVGSGVLVSPSGYIVTNRHVIEGARAIEVTLSDKRHFDATVVGKDPSTDLAVLKIDAATDLPAIGLGNSDAVQVGEWVVAVGNPFRLTSTVTAGIVSALGRQVNIINDSFRIEDFIQTDAAINPGNSGGALVNLAGELVGVNTAIATESGSYEGYGFAVPVNLVERVVTDLIEYGEVQRGYLGVTIQDVDAQAARQLGLDRIGGVYIEDVRRGGAADRAGVRQGDVVLSIEDRLVDAPNELQSAVASRRPGDRLDVAVWRDGARRAFEVELMGRDAPAYEGWISALRGRSSDTPLPEASPPEGTDEDSGGSAEGDAHLLFDLERWGLGVRAAEARERAAFDGKAGAYVARVEPGSLAGAAGLPEGVLLTQVEDQPVASVRAFLRALQQAAAASDAVLVRVQRRNGLQAFYEIEVP